VLFLAVVDKLVVGALNWSASGGLHLSTKLEILGHKIACAEVREIYMGTEVLVTRRCVTASGYTGFCWPGNGCHGSKLSLMIRL
jgi:hypothetical protein